MRSRHISQVVHASPHAVYDFASEPDNLPQWAAGLTDRPVRREGDALVVESPMGTVTVRFVPRNEFQVIDHDVTLPNGTTVNNPGRVLAHPEGAEVVFTLRQADLTDEEFDRDSQQVADDLGRLKRLVERLAGQQTGG